MPPKLTIDEKRARGTHQAVRDSVRALDEVRDEIAETLESLEDMRHNPREAGKAIRKEGVLIDVVTRNNAGDEVRRKKLNAGMQATERHADGYQGHKAGSSLAARGRASRGQG